VVGIISGMLWCFENKEKIEQTNFIFFQYTLHANTIEKVKKNLLNYVDKDSSFKKNKFKSLIERKFF
jgi:hypothetical protein